MDINMKELQTELDSLHNGAVLQLLPGEYAGPISIRNSVVMDGQGSTIWGLKGPVLTIKPDGVVLRNIRIEVTGKSGTEQPEDGCALLIKSSKSPTFENVEVRGSVIGLHEEEGEWYYPHSLHLGHLSHGAEHTFIIRIAVPVPCQLHSDISGVNIEPRNLDQGSHKIQLHVERLPDDTLLNGCIRIISTSLNRTIMVNALILNKGVSGDQGNGQLIWEPKIPEKNN